ncbi:hypothetical protein ZHAS_00019135 [Anopheles sinensis]|uniref:Uncharacterized protein n=1 Tax=Anopheles sinensis TaxID=74873 RepID=A0A084WLI5_ANOSI|nr:hypothetical protein ZHAS_00019135 [Anopheles sinensis]
MRRRNAVGIVLLFLTFLDNRSTSQALPNGNTIGPTAPSDEESAQARAGPFDIRPPLAGTSTEKPSTSDRPLGGASELLGGAGLPELPGPGASQQSSPPGASLIMGAFQAIITPFNPGMIGGALGGGTGSGTGGLGGIPIFPMLPSGSKP